MLSAGEKLKVVLNRKGMTITDLAEKTGQTKQNLTNKFKRNNFTEKDIQVLAAALDCTAELIITLDTGEKI